MKKRSVFVVLLLVIPVLSYFLRYTKSIDLNNKIPTSAQAVIHLNVRQLEKCLLFDVVKHPLDYISFESSDSDSEDEEETILGQIDLPQDFFFYSTSPSYSDDYVWISSSVAISDREQFIQLLNKEGFDVISDEPTLLLKNNCAIVCKKETVIVSFFNIKNKEKALLAIRNSINATQFYGEESALLQPILNSEAPINYVSSSGDFIQITTHDGLVKATGKLESTLFDGLPTTVDKHKLSVGLFETKIDTNHLFYKKLKEKIALSQWNAKTNISIDSFAKYWDGSLRIDLEAIKKEKDTIITYDYDEDFNKVEIKAVQESNIPIFQVQLGTTKGSGLFRYLSDRKIVRLSNSDTLFIGLPIYQTYVNLLHGSFNISSKNELKKINKSNDKFKVNSYLNIEEYVSKPLEFSNTTFLNNELLQTMQGISLQYKMDNKIAVELKMKEANRNSLATMVLALLNN